MPNDGLRAVNIYALETAANKLVLIDGGWAVQSAWPELESALATIGRTGQDISDIFVTHIHRDHYTFAIELRETFGARVHLGSFERPGLHAIQELHNNVPQSSLRELRRADADELAKAIELLAGEDPFDNRGWGDPDSWLEPGEINIPGWSIEAVHTPGHTKGHLIYHDLEKNLIFSGDHILPTITPSIGFELGDWDLPLKKYLSSLQLMLNRPNGKLLPAHGFPTESAHDRVLELLDHHAQRFAEVYQGVQQIGPDANALQVAKQLRWTRRLTPFGGLDDFNQMIAVCETLAHLDVLVDRGELTSQRMGEVELFSLF